jgi:hypothetical protein
MLWLAVRACSDGPWRPGPREAEALVAAVGPGVLVICVTDALALGLAGPVELSGTVGLAGTAGLPGPAGDRVLGVAPTPGKPVAP